MSSTFRDSGHVADGVREPLQQGSGDSERWSSERGRRHKTVVDWARQAVLQAKRWLPDRRLIVLTDAGFSGVSLIAALCRHACLVTRLRISGPMHIAAAVHTPSVAIVGGFEYPVNTHYAGNPEFYTLVPCSPCWLLKPCPFGLKCLHAISSGQVTRAVQEMWAKVQGWPAVASGVKPII